MVGQIDISPDGTQLLISFPYRPDLVEVVKTIPGRRWDRGTKTWKVPISEVEICVKTFMAHGFHLSPDVATALASGGTADVATMELAKVDQEAPALTVSQLNLRVAEVLTSRFDEPMWIVGELQNYKPKGRARHKYFELVERSEDEFDEAAAPRAIVEAVIFEQNSAVINRRLRRSGNALTLADGVKIRVRGKVDLYQPRGKYQFVIDDIDPNYTLGELVARREKILLELEKAKLLTRQKELPMPRVPLRIALVTSFGSDAYNDFVQTLAGTGFNFDVTVFDCFVQGERLEESVLEALTAFEGAEDDYDLLVITRGGGSRSELGAWDNLAVCQAVAAHPLKAMIAIGHEKDRSVLDEIAMSVKTPTAAAELLLTRAREYQEHVEDTMLEIADRAKRIARDEIRELHTKARSLGQIVRAGLAGARTRLRAARERVQRATKTQLAERRGRVARAGRDLERGVIHRIERERLRVATRSQRVVAGSSRQVERAAERTEMLNARVRAVDPRRVLQRGFAILRGSNGKALRSVQGVKKDATLSAQLSDGRLDVEVRKVHD